MPHRPRRTLATAIAIVCAIAALVATGGPAQAATPPGTLIFIKAHNIWIANGDGTGQTPITTDGTSSSPYSSPTMADNGTIAAVHNLSAVRLSSAGTILNNIPTPPLPTSNNGHTSAIPASVAISPDASKIVYSQVAFTSSPVRYASGYAAANGSGTVGTPTYFKAPSWVSNTRTLQNGGYGSQIQLDTVVGSSVHWFDDHQMHDPHADLSDPEVSRDGKWLIALRGFGTETHVLWYTVSGDPATQSPPPLPTAACGTGTDPSLSSPTAAPDGSALAWAESDGIWIKNSPTSCSTPQPALRIAGGSEPSWSKAAYAVPSKAFSISTNPSISGVPKAGKILTARVGTWSPAPSTYAYQWRRNGTPISGATRSTYQLTSSDAGKRISVTVTGARSGHVTTARTSGSVSVALHNTRRPTISGTKKVGRSLKATKGSWTPRPTSYAYQWYRGSKAIKGATKSTYRLKKADRGKKIRVKVVAKRPGARSGSALSAYTNKVR